MLQAAHASLDAGRYQEAIAAYTAILKRDQRNVDAITHLGVILALAGHHAEALEAFDRALAIDPDYAHALWDKAGVQEARQDHAGAVATLERFVRVAPAGPDRDRAAGAAPGGEGPARGRAEGGRARRPSMSPHAGALGQASPVTVIPELGAAALLAALVVAVAGAVSGVRASRDRRPGWLASARRAAVAQFALVTLAVVALEYLLITSDFSVRYVANTSVSASPLRYRIAGLWGALEGSILLWEWLQALFVLLVARRAAALRRELSGYALAVLFVVSGVFLVMMTAIASPFERLPQPALEGRGLNPLLEVTDMLVHPLPALHGLRGLRRARSPSRWPRSWPAGSTARWLTLTRRWTVTAWLFLTERDPVRRLVVVPDAGLGRLLGVGPGGERLVHALAHGHGVRPLGHGPGAAADAEDLEHDPDHADLRAHDLRDLPHPERRDRVGPRVRQRQRSGPSSSLTWPRSC